MKTITLLLLCTLLLPTALYARGGFSSGGSRGGFSTSRSFSSPRSVSASRGISSPRSVTTTSSIGSRSTVTTTHITTNRYVSSPSYYGTMGPGYGYSDGMIHGLILGNLMHPANTVVYAGGGAWQNQALLYPDGRVVNPQGYQVGTYTNGAFTPMDNGPLVAQPVPSNAVTPVQDNDTTAVWVSAAIVIVILIVIISTL